MGHLVITIGCEYGAKGNAIGRKIAEDLGIKFYDRDLVDQIIEEVGIPKDIMNRVEEGGTIAGKGAEGDVRGSFSKYADLTERAIHVQKQIIRKLAEKEACVIIGRSADYILKDSKDIKLLRAFIYAPDEIRIQNIMKSHSLSESDAKILLLEKDKRYHKRHLALTGSSTGVSNAVFPYRQLLPQDINGDGIIELPSPDTSWTAEQTDGLVSWLCCNGDGQLSTVAKTYHSLSCGWYFTIPESWWDWSVETATTSISNENQFSLAINGDPVLSLYTITGENRENRGRMGKRVLLRRQTATIYAGELNDAAAYYGMDEDLLRRSFSLIVGSWSN